MEVESEARSIQCLISLLVQWWAEWALPGKCIPHLTLEHIIERYALKRMGCADGSYNSGL